MIDAQFHHPHPHPTPHRERNILTPSSLQVMCQAENSVHGHIGYGEHCVHPKLYLGKPPKQWMRSCVRIGTRDASMSTDGLNRTRQQCCLQPPRSIVSAFYVTWVLPDAGSTPPDEWTLTFEELFMGVAWNRSPPP